MPRGLTNDENIILWANRKLNKTGSQTSEKKFGLLRKFKTI